MRDLFRGELVRITAEEPETYAKSEIHWHRDSEFVRLADSDPIQLSSEKKIKEWAEKRFEKGLQPDRYSFAVRTLDEDKLIGFLGLGINLIHSEAWVGIGIGEREFWGKGYGTDMMKLCLQYVFTELCVERVSLGLHEYNPRALRSYEKCGFRLEGRTRQDIMREGRRTDTLWMGILREEWEAMQNNPMVE
ncbi:MAG TPA: GNAT family protein [Anaerolineales bacterium]|nr:GNAT family protein [Anaerolineales bacterium]HLE92439.1 GNAT family protein [Anaerolineales bacterium]